MHTKELTIHVHILSICEVGSDRALGTCEHLVFSGIFFRSVVVQKVLLNLSFIMLPNSGRLLCCCVNTDENYNFIS